MGALIFNVLFLFGLFLSGCAVRSGDFSFEAIRGAIEEPEQMVWRDGVREIKKQLLQEIEQGGLTQENAIQLALVNNPDLFAYYENLERGYADLLEAGLTQNPFFSANIRFPSQSCYHNLFDVAISFLDLFFLPFRKRVAEVEIKVIEAEMGKRVFDLVKEVQINWFEIKALELQFRQEKKGIELKRLKAKLADFQKNAGNIKARNRKVQYEEAVGKIKDLEAALLSSREKMNRILGLFGNEAFWKTSSKFESIIF